jgi:hypothetical protein
MPSILMSVETTIIHRLTSWSNISQNKCVSHPSIQYDYELRNEIRNMAANHLLPNVFEPFKSQGILVEFPLLEASWIDVYLSVNCHYRFGHPMEELYQVSLHNTPGNLSKSTFHSDFSLEVVI